MTTIAMAVLEAIERSPAMTQAQKNELLGQVPAHQWAVDGGHWHDLAKHCGQRVEVRDEPRFMNRLSIYRIQPLPRCLYRSPDGRGLAWLKSGGEVEVYGRCEQAHCERTRGQHERNEP